MKAFNKFVKPITILLFSGFFFTACSEDDEDNIETKIVEVATTTKNYSLKVNFEHLANGNIIQMNTSNKPYTNAKGQPFNVTKLRYLVSEIQLHQSNGLSFTFPGYHLVDVSDTTTFVYSPSEKVPAGDYTSVSFNFGFDRAANQSSIYQDLNTVFWNWPMVFGGGYHFMQFEGKFDTSGVEGGFATHMGTAMNIGMNDTTYEDNHFRVELANASISINTNTEITVQMHIEQWYENPYTWDFKVYNMPIMPVYDAQRKLNLNGPTVFTLKP